jgi:hypothetical protein
MRLVDGWKRAHRWFSVQAMGVAAAVQLTWATLADDLKHSIPMWIPTVVTVVLLVLGVAGRVVKQPEKDKEK